MQCYEAGWQQLEPVAKNRELLSCKNFTILSFHQSLKSTHRFVSAFSKMRNATLTKDEAARTAYQHHRNQLKTRDFQQRSDYKIRETLSEKEKTASKRLAAVRGNDLAAFLERFNGMHPAQTHICNLRSFLNGNKTNLNSWQLIREVDSCLIKNSRY